MFISISFQNPILRKVLLLDGLSKRLLKITSMKLWDALRKSCKIKNNFTPTPPFYFISFLIKIIVKQEKIDSIATQLMNLIG
jgi:hypothetical protein